MEYVSLGDLEKNVIANSGKIPESEARSIAEQILSGLEIMHAESFAHRDLKPQNVLVVNGPPSWWVKLADFGLSKKLTDTTAFYTKSGTQSYMAPEILNYLSGQDSNDQYTNSVDIWALGCIVYRLITGTIPFPPGKSLIKYCEDKSLFPYDALFDSGIKSEGSKFLRRLLTAQPTDRPAASQALRHPWILSGHTYRKSSLEVPTPAVGVLSEFTDLSLLGSGYDTKTHDGLRSIASSSTSQPTLFADQTQREPNISTTIKRKPLATPLSETTVKPIKETNVPDQKPDQANSFQTRLSQERSLQPEKLKLASRINGRTLGTIGFGSGFPL
ncbi:kinase-like domain-containing protein [Leptodontidium sp. 2 PMI_412]|nr:kinase-like domain-containing protein [Leptodontidium sp. 2 PMI_412]